MQRVVLALGYAILVPMVGCSSAEDTAGSIRSLEDCHETAYFARSASSGATCIAEGASVPFACGVENETRPTVYCVEKDGVKYWGGARSPLTLFEGFSFCNDPQPRLCALQSCALVKPSLSSNCSLEDTKRAWGCGSNELDEDCCWRESCVDSDDCGAGTHCELLDGAPQQACFVTDVAGTCVCGGTLGSASGMFCVPD